MPQVSLKDPTIKGAADSPKGHRQPSELFSPARLLPIFGLLSVSLLFWITFSGLNAATILFLDDQAFAMALGELVNEGARPLLGLPSHLGARHIGPFYLWVMGGVMAMADGDPETATLLLAAMKVASLLMLAWFTAVFTQMQRKRFLLPAVICVFASCLGFYPWILRVDWANNFLLVSATAALIGTHLLLKVGWSALPIGLVTWSVLVQTHLSAVPFSCGLAGVSFLRLFFAPITTIYATPLPKVVQGTAWLLLLTIWAPVLYYEAAFESNFAALLNAHGSSAGEASGFFAAVITFLHFVTTSLVVPTSFQPSSSIASLSGIALLGLCSLVIAVRWNRLTEDARWFLIAIACGTILMVIAAAQVTAPVHEYYYYTLLPLPPFLLAVCISPSLIITKSSAPQKIRAIAITLTGGCLLYLSVVYRYTGDHEPKWHTLKHAQEVHKLMINYTGSQDFYPVMLKKRDGLRANTFYYLSGTEAFPLMQFNKRMLEFLPEESENKTRSLRKAASTRWYLACPKREGFVVGDTLRAMKAKWQSVELVDTSSCSTCGGCELYVLRKLADT